MKMSAIFLGLFLAASVHAMELPQPPPDLFWKEVPEINAAFLVPNGWHFKLLDQWYFKLRNEGNKLAFFITQEDIDKEGQFYTGLTINVFRGGKPASTVVEYAKSYINQVAADNHADETWTQQFGSLQGFGCRFKATNLTGSPIVRTLMAANPKTGTRYIFIFEAPDANWTDAWAKGEKIMNSLIIDENI
jgi:hypothetical protein